MLKTTNSSNKVSKNQSLQKRSSMSKIHIIPCKPKLYANSSLKDIIKSRKQYLANTYNTTPCILDKYRTNNLIFNEKSILVAQFKDYLIIDDSNEFLKRYYKFYESMTKLDNILNYYTLYYPVYPNLIILPESKYIYKNIRRKIKLSNLIVDKSKKTDEFNQFIHIFSESICNSIINQTDFSKEISVRTDFIPIIHNSNIVNVNKVKNKEKNNDNEKNHSKLELLGLIEKFGFESKEDKTIIIVNRNKQIIVPNGNILKSTKEFNNKTRNPNNIINKQLSTSQVKSMFKTTLAKTNADSIKLKNTKVIASGLLSSRNIISSNKTTIVSTDRLKTAERVIPNTTKHEKNKINFIKVEKKENGISKKLNNDDMRVHKIINKDNKALNSNSNTKEINNKTTNLIKSNNLSNKSLFNNSKLAKPTSTATSKNKKITEDNGNRKITSNNSNHNITKSLFNTINYNSALNTIRESVPIKESKIIKEVKDNKIKPQIFVKLKNEAKTTINRK